MFNIRGISFVNGKDFINNALCVCTTRSVEKIYYLHFEVHMISFSSVWFALVCHEIVNGGREVFNRYVVLHHCPLVVGL